MKRASLLAVMLLAGSVGTASAGTTYLGLGIGTSPEMNDQTDRLASDSRSGRFLIGNRWGAVSLEGALGGYSTTLAASNGVPLPFGDAYQLSGALKLNLPLGNNFEAFARGGVHHTWINTDDSMRDVSGNGLLIGAGFEYRINMIVGQGSLFVDYQYNKATLEGETFSDKRAFDASYRMFTMGLTVGL